MTVLWRTGFEPSDPFPYIGGPDAGDVWGVVTSPVMTGVQCLRLKKVSLATYTGPFLNQAPLPPTTDTFAVGFEVRFPVLPVGGEYINLAVLYFTNAMYDEVAKLYFSGSGISLAVAYPVAESSAVVPVSILANEKHMIEVDFIKGTAGGYKVYFDGVLIINMVRDTSAATVSHAMIGLIDTHYMAEVYIDEVQFADAPLGPVVPTATITGTVSDVTGSLLSGATVTAGSYSVITNISGVYSLSVPFATYIVTASKVGYVSQSVTVNVSTGGTVTQNFTISVSPTPPRPSMLIPAVVTFGIISVLLLTFARRKK